jgi:hypothetical protein
MGLSKIMQWLQYVCQNVNMDKIKSRDMATINNTVNLKYSCKIVLISHMNVK